MFKSKWGFTCDCRLCNLPMEETVANDATLASIKDLQSKILKRESQSQQDSLQDLHRLLAACYKVADIIISYHLYFNIQRTDKYSIAMCYIIITIIIIIIIIVIIIIKVADQDQTLLKYVLLAIHHGRQGRVSEEDLAQSELVTEDVRGFLEETLGRKFWTNLDIYEVELIKIAKIFGCQDSVTKIMQMPWSADFYSELLKMVCCSKKYFFC